MLALLLWAGTARAYTADLELTGRQSGQVITQTRTQTLELALNNLGPENATNVVVSNSLGYPPDVIVTVLPGCTVSTSRSILNAGWTVYTWQVGDVSAGSGRTCTLSFQARPTAANRQFVAGQSITFDPARVDPGPFNNTVNLPAFTVSATDVVTDLSLSVSSSPSLVSPGTSGTITVTARNLGPDAASNVVALTSHAYGTTGQIRLFGRPDTTCTIFFEDVGTSTGGQRSASIALGAIPAGQAVSCTFGVEVFPTASGALALPFGVQSSGFGVFDPNQENNSAGLVLQFTAMSVPILSAWGALFLVAAMLCLSIFAGRTLRRRNEMSFKRRR